MIAYKHGNSDYIIDTTHPTSDDYLKFVEEEQASLKSGKTRFFSISPIRNHAFDFGYWKFTSSRETVSFRISLTFISSLMQMGERYPANVGGV